MRKTKLILFILLTLLLTVVLVISACGTSTTSSTDQKTESIETESTAAKTEPIKLTFAASFPEVHPMSIADKAVFDKLEADTNGQAKVTSYFGGALVSGKEAYTELAKGVADMAEYSGAYVPDGFEIEKSMRCMFYGLPAGLEGMEIGRKVYNELREKYPVIDEEHGDIKITARQAITPYQLLTTKKPVTKVEELKGLTLKVTGEYSDVLNKMGVNAVVVPMSETYVALQKGMIDGLLGPYETLKSFKFGEVVNYATPLNLTCGPTPHRGMNLDTYNSLPPEIQKWFDENEVFWGTKLEEALNAADDAGVEFAKSEGVEFLEMDPGELEKFYSIMNEVMLEKMKEVDAAGKPGTEMYNDARRLIEEYSK